MTDGASVEQVTRPGQRGDALVPSPERQRTGELAVSAEGIGKRFNNEDVITDLSFQVSRGTIFGLIGPSGCGKTTTVRMLLGVLRPTAGKLLVLGREPHTFRRRDRERLGYMPQQFVLFPELSVMENMGFAASIYGMNFFGRAKHIRRALELVELWEARNRPAGKLSGGMQRRLELAATLLHAPDVIFLDEPTAGIDPVLRAKFWEHFRALRDDGCTLIVTTQYVTEAEYCDEILVLRDGEKVATGTPEEVRRLAMGGELVVVAGGNLSNQDRRVILGVDGVRAANWAGRDRLEVVVEDAGLAVPILVDALREANIEVDEISEQRPSFDEIFVTLMEERRAAPRL
ncbi:MAG: ATP-binding cassette domain-containing protein [Chloroflexota bacterium]